MEETKISNTLVGVAGVHYVVCELSRRGVIALPTTRNTAGYDVIVVRRDGKKHANLQVKTSGNPDAKFWPVAKHVEGIHRGENEFYVLLRGLQKGSEVEAYMLEGRQVVKEVKGHYKGLRGEKIKKLSHTACTCGPKPLTNGLLSGGSGFSELA